MVVQSRYSGGMSSLADLFSPDGPLARHLPGYTHRDAQEDMAHGVATALARSQHLAVEAGTGIGKTFGYLVPALLSGKRAVISTGTLTLQDQLYGRDLPLLGSASGRPVRWVGYARRVDAQRCGADDQSIRRTRREDPPKHSEAVSYTHLTLPTSDLV